MAAFVACSRNGGMTYVKAQKVQKDPPNNILDVEKRQPAKSIITEPEHIQDKIKAKHNTHQVGNKIIDEASIPMHFKMGQPDFSIDPGNLVVSRKPAPELLDQGHEMPKKHP